MLMWDHLERISTPLFSKIHRFGLYWTMNHYVFPNHLNNRIRMKLFYMYLLVMKPCSIKKRTTTLSRKKFIGKKNVLSTVCLVHEVECDLRILSDKWRIFHRPLNVTKDLAVDIKKACCVLHNYVLEKNGYVFQDTLTIDGFNEIERPSNINRGTRFVSDIRNTFADIP
ncbi:unnamed protein product [Macrosiphum euphorbiae]|uniref:DDE Tnp4 domain-containing protein n=1 Tax=Macrosiphum euphorbiae TaxID=13131 RepID=A0AAV0WR21_9HEMI|nr:unnamed protein product [Macrosiphum euphorbiae]